MQYFSFGCAFFALPFGRFGVKLLVGGIGGLYFFFGADLVHFFRLVITNRITKV